MISSFKVCQILVSPCTLSPIPPLPTTHPGPVGNVFTARGYLDVDGRADEQGQDATSSGARSCRLAFVTQGTDLS